MVPFKLKLLASAGVTKASHARPGSSDGSGSEPLTFASLARHYTQTPFNLGVVDRVRPTFEGEGPAGKKIELENLAFLSKGGSRQSGWVEGFAPPDDFCALHSVVGELQDCAVLRYNCPEGPQAALVRWFDNLRDVLFDKMTALPPHLKSESLAEALLHTEMKINICDIVLTMDPNGPMFSPSEKTATAQLHRQLEMIENERRGVLDSMAKMAREVFSCLVVELKECVFEGVPYASLNEYIEKDCSGLLEKMKEYLGETSSQEGQDVAAQSRQVSFMRDPGHDFIMFAKTGIIEWRSDTDDRRISIPMDTRNIYFNQKTKEAKLAALRSFGDDLVEPYFKMISSQGYWWDNRDLAILAKYNNLCITLLYFSNGQQGAQSESEPRIEVVTLNEGGDRQVALVHRINHYTPLVFIPQNCPRFLDEFVARVVGVDGDIEDEGDHLTEFKTVAVAGAMALFRKREKGEAFPEVAFSLLCDAYLKQSNLAEEFVKGVLLDSLERAIRENKEGKIKASFKKVGSEIVKKLPKRFQHNLRVARHLAGAASGSSKSPNQVGYDAVEVFIKRAKRIAESNPISPGFNNVSRARARTLLDRLEIKYKKSRGQYREVVSDAEGHSQPYSANGRGSYRVSSASLYPDSYMF